MKICRVQGSWCKIMRMVQGLRITKLESLLEISKETYVIGLLFRASFSIRSG